MVPLNIHSFVGRKFMGATDTTKTQCYVEPGLWGQGNSSIMNLETIPERHVFCVPKS